MKLSKYEKETIILTNEEDQYYSVYTYNQGLQKRLKNFAEKYPECCYLFNTTKEENKMYDSKGTVVIEFKISIYKGTNSEKLQELR